MLVNKKGFTLLEILIALFVLTILSFMMARALHTVLSAQTITEKNAARFSALQIALLILDQDISQTVNRPIKNAFNQEENAVVGNSQSISFTHLGLQAPLS